MKIRIIWLINISLALSSVLLYADDYETAQRFSDGDVVSASVLNDILDRIELTLKPITVSELVGTWTAKQMWCSSGSSNSYGKTNYCQDSTNLSGTSVEKGLALTRTDTVTIADNGDGTFSWTTANYNLLYSFNIGFSRQQVNTGNLTHTCYLPGPQIAACVSDPSLTWENGSEEARVIYAMTMRRTSPTQLTMWTGPSNGNLFSFNSLTLDKDAQAPEAPTSLAGTISSNAISLSWTTPTDATSYEVHRKTTATGTFASIGTSTSASYADSSVASGSTYWYRVFAKNDNGTSTGSNVIKVTFNPSVSLSSSSIGITDFLNGVASAESEHKIVYSTASNTMTASLGVGKLDAENLNGLLAGSGGKSPVLKFTLANVPSAGMSGTATLASKVLDGSDATLNSGERAITATVDVSWSSDGETLTLTVPNQSSTVTLTGTNGISVAGTWDVCGSSDLVTINSNGVNQPVSLDVKLLAFLSSNIAGTGPSIGSFFSAGDYFYEIAITGIDLKDVSGNAFTKVQGSFGVDSNPASVVYVEDISVSEGLDLATVLVTLSTVTSDAVTLDYVTSGSTATSGTDFTASSGSIRIAAGTRQGAFLVPLTDDTSSESDETFTVTLSNLTNAVFGRNTATVTIQDNDSAT